MPVNDFWNLLHLNHVQGIAIINFPNVYAVAGFSTNRLEAQ
jgi:hypothetical protein